MSRYRHRVVKTKIRKDSRTIPLRGHQDYGDGRDANRYWRCWNCGFICDVERDELGGSESKANITYEIYEALYSGGPKKGTNNTDYLETDAMMHGDIDGVPLLTMASARSGHVLLENGPDGNPRTVRLNWTPTGGSGCPLCHTPNWRGDY